MCLCQTMEAESFLLLLLWLFTEHISFFFFYRFSVCWFKGRYNIFPSGLFWVAFFNTQEKLMTEPQFFRNILSVWHWQILTAAVSLPVKCVTVTLSALPLNLRLALRSRVRDKLEMLFFEKHTLAVGANPSLLGALTEAAALHWQVRRFKQRKCNPCCCTSRRAGTSRLSNTNGSLKTAGRCFIEVPLPVLQCVHLCCRQMNLWLI